MGLTTLNSSAYLRQNKLQFENESGREALAEEGELQQYPCTAQTEGSISARGSMKRVGRGNLKPAMKNFTYF